MKLPDFKTALKDGVAELEKLFGEAPPEARNFVVTGAVDGIAKLRSLAETEVEHEVDKVIPPSFTAPTNAMIAEGLDLLASQAKAQLEAKVAQIEAAQAEVANVVAPTVPQ